ncbi:molybdate ABC transporter substrate-binding protein [Ureibacillus sp. FSL K6-3587]|uniref:molybdate ABC transporter substrate-binding protein n=1 Tax=Ureibacillus sp. FSL K6-3587 TaxID=2954681 RepID=UPI00315837CE
MKKLCMLAAILLCTFILAACSNSDQESEKVKLTVSAAASLKDALEEIKQHYEKEHPDVSLTFNYGSSGSLKQQILQGAPVDLFFSAAIEPYDELVEKGIIEEGTNLLGNELALIVPTNNHSIKLFEDLATEDIHKMSIGTPETVPAGQYAKETLEQMNLWEAVESKLVYAKDVRQVLSYVETGNVDAGIVYKTDALVSDKVKIAATADESIHAPIMYPVGVIKESQNYDAAKSFYQYLQSENAIKVFEAYGFTVK